MYQARIILFGKLNANLIKIIPRISLLSANNTTTYTDECKAELLDRSFASQFSPNPTLARQNQLSQVSETFRMALATRFDNSPPIFST